MTDTIRKYPWLVPIVAAVVGAAALVYFKWIKPRRSATDFPFRFAADELPPGDELAAERRGQLLRHGRVFSSEVLEKITLISLIGIIFAQIVPNIEATPIQITVGVAVLVALDTLVSLWAVRRGEAQLRWTFRAFFELMVLNAGPRPVEPPVLLVPAHAHHRALRPLPVRLRGKIRRRNREATGPAPRRRRRLAPCLAARGRNR